MHGPRHLRLFALVVVALVAALAPGCKKSGPSKGEKAAAKQAKDAELLALAYPKSSGVQPKSIEIVYDAANDRTMMTLRLSDLRASGVAGVSRAALHLTSSHKGRVRPADNPEGSIDGSVVVVSSTAGVLAYSGAPGTVIADGKEMPLKEAGKSGYASAPLGTGYEEATRFKWATPDVVSAANASAVAMTFGKVRIEMDAAALADLREFAARLNPKP